MDVARVRALHRYGAVLSILASLGAIVVAVVAGPNSVLLLFLGWAGPLGGFYFVGATLSDTVRYRVLGEELLRGIVWYFGSLISWALVITSTTALPATPFTTFGLPALTALALVLVMVVLRRSTGHDLKARTERGQLLVALVGVVAGALLVCYLVLIEDYATTLLLGYLLATAAGLALWWRF